MYCYFCVMIKVADEPTLHEYREATSEQEQDRKIMPQPGGQVMFLSSPAYEVLFGGSAGGGKSWALMVDALGLQYQPLIGKCAYEIPGYRAFIFRRTKNRFGNLIDKAKKLYYTLGARFILSRTGEPGSFFEFPSGAKIFFCEMERVSDKEKYQGYEIHYAGFDELGEFEFEQYIYIFSRVRCDIPGLTTRIRGTCNPLGVGLRWLKERFIKGSEKYRIYSYLPPKEDENADKDFKGVAVPHGTEKSITRQFIPGFLHENKKLVQEDPNYENNIRAMGSRYVRALLHGDWDAFGGNMFNKLSRDIHYIKPFDIPDDWSMTISMDYGNVTCAHILRKNPANKFVYITHEWTEFNQSTSHKISSFYKFLNASGVLDWAKRTNNRVTVKADTNMFGTQNELEEKVSPADKFNAFFKPYNVVFVPVSKKSPNHKNFRVFCVDEVSDAIDWKTNDKGQYLRVPRLYFFAGRCEKLFESLFELQADENNPEDIADTDNDHWFDSMKYGLISIRKNEIDAKAIKDKLSKKFAGHGNAPIV